MNTYDKMKLKNTYAYSTHVVEVYIPRRIVYGENCLWALPHNKMAAKGPGKGQSLLVYHSVTVTSCYL